MRSWSFSAKDVRRLVIAADARLSKVDYADDQIWQLSLAGGDPAALALETTYGLRAPSMRLFISITANGKHVIDPADFAVPPSVQALLPNYMLVTAYPVAGLQLRQEYWVHDSHAVIGRIGLTNRGDAAVELDVRLHAVLKPGSAGTPFSPVQVDGVYVLSAELEKLAPVIFMEGGAETPPSAFPSLGVHAQLSTGRSRSWLWAHAGERERRASFDRARMLCGRPWEASIARLKMINAGLVDIETGDPEWDAAFWLTQVAAIQAFTGPTRFVQHPGIIGRRRITDGFSSQGDGSEYDGAWGGVDAATAHSISRQILVAEPGLVEGEVRNRLQTETGAGVIDGQPGLGGQRAGWESMPLLADLLERLYDRTGNERLLAELYPALQHAVRAWFAEARDQDGDGFPEWRHMPQSGYRAWPAYAGWARWGQGLDIAMVERPDLAAYLFRELTALARMTERTGDARAQDWLRATAETLRQSLETGWVDKKSIYVARDRDLDTPLQGERLGRGKGSYTLEVRRGFEEPVRVLIRCFGDELGSKSSKITLRGKGNTNRRMVERMSHASFQWFWKMGVATAQKAARTLDTVTVDGLDESYTTEIWLADTTQEEVAGLLPLWAGMMEPERARQMVANAVLDERRFWRTCGIPAISARESGYDPEKEGNPGAVWMFANGLVGEGMLATGFRAEAADLVGRLMRVVIAGLRRDHDFSALYHPDQELPLGEAGHFDGLAPLGLFLDTLGLRLGDPHRVQVEPGNPYPWPVTVRWRGMSVVYDDDQVTVTFPDGGLARVAGEGGKWVEQGKDESHPG